MTTITYKPVDSMVQSMRRIRDEISNEIKDMTFAEERAFLDELLYKEHAEATIAKKSNANKSSPNTGI